MSSRLTAPVSKLTRSFGTSPAVARPSHLLSNAPKAAAAAATGAGRKTKPAADEPAERNHSTTTTTTTTTTTPHRPLLPQHQQRIIPFMQTFHHSAPKPLPPTFTTIDRAILPDLSSAQHHQTDPYAHIRMPLLPDNSAVRHLQPEAADAPLPQPEILVVAANPEQVLPAALTEVEGMGVDGVELGFVHLMGREGEQEERYEMAGGMIRDLWRGMVDDVFGGSQGKGKGGAAPA
ncbi:hypothetical protein C8A01DRAFT_19162 [Parachaetomium inaequale]|uniref:Uncharacterized protein n=1 Tax=Parachaetomium inaequale TaxID=2588326 RepID=A0AAN6PCP3_9PEZI|nr:hypothetical protein C8A01DRAFT_19162 [Parachaetomium inaequale]